MHEWEGDVYHPLYAPLCVEWEGVRMVGVCRMEGPGSMQTEQGNPTQAQGGGQPPVAQKMQQGGRKGWGHVQSGHTPLHVPVALTGGHVTGAVRMGRAPPPFDPHPLLAPEGDMWEVGHTSSQKWRSGPSSPGLCARVTHKQGATWERGTPDAIMELDW